MQEHDIPGSSLRRHDDHVSIDPESGVPVYRQLAGILAGQIERGEITRRLPSENTLIQTYGLALGTVRKAIGVLRDEGLVFTTPGVGTFVRQD